MSAARSKEVAPKGGDKLPAVQDEEFLDEEGLGLEGLSQNEQVTPFLVMMQGLSPQLNPSKAGYVPGAALGDIVDTGTQEVYPGPTGVDMLVCARWYGYKMWIPRDLDGGFRGDLEENHQLVRDTLARMAEKYGQKGAKFNMPRYDGKTRRWSDVPALHPETGEEVELQETGQLYVLYGAPGQLTSRDRVRKAIVNFKSTSMGAYQGFVSRHLGWTWPTRDGRRVPANLWHYRYNLSTMDSSNASGEFKVWQTRLAAPATTYREAAYGRDDPELYLMARRFYDQFMAGGVKVDQDAERRRADSEEIPL